MDLETQIQVMGDAVRRHCKGDLMVEFYAADCDMLRVKNGWTYPQLRHATACLIRILDDFLLVEEAENLAKRDTSA